MDRAQNSVCLRPVKKFKPDFYNRFLTQNTVYHFLGHPLNMAVSVRGNKLVWQEREGRASEIILEIGLRLFSRKQEVSTARQSHRKKNHCWLPFLSLSLPQIHENNEAKNTKLQHQNTTKMKQIQAPENNETKIKHQIQ